LSVQLDLSSWGIAVLTSAQIANWSAGAAVPGSLWSGALDGRYYCIEATLARRIGQPLVTAE